MVDLKKFTVLVVDDDLDLRELMASIFEDQGFTVLSADSGVSAFELVKVKLSKSSRKAASPGSRGACPSGQNPRSRSWLQRETAGDASDPRNGGDAAGDLGYGAELQLGGDGPGAARCRDGHGDSGNRRNGGRCGIRCHLEPGLQRLVYALRALFLRLRNSRCLCHPPCGATRPSADQRSLIRRRSVADAVCPRVRLDPKTGCGFHTEFSTSAPKRKCVACRGR